MFSHTAIFSELCLLSAKTSPVWHTKEADVCPWYAETPKITCFLAVLREKLLDGWNFL